MTDFLFLGSKVTADCDWSHEIRRQFLPGRKEMTNLDSVLNSRDTALPTKVYIVKAMVFPVVMGCCERWTVKKTECWRMDAFELWCWNCSESLDSKEIKPVNLKGNQPWILIWRTDADAETPVFWSSDINRWLTGKVPDAEKDWGQRENRAVRGWDGWIVSPMQWTWTWANFRRWWGTERPSVLQSTGLQNWTQLGNWITKPITWLK